MSYKLNKPFSEKEKLDFTVEFNHNQGLLIKETDTALYALEPWEELQDDVVIDNSKEYNEKQAQIEKEKINNLSLTSADVERALYKAKGIDFDDILELIKDNSEFDPKALKIELKANNFYRGNPLINKIGAILGFSNDELDYLFKFKRLPEKGELANA